AERIVRHLRLGKRLILAPRLTAPAITASRSCRGSPPVLRHPAGGAGTIAGEPPAGPRRASPMPRTLALCVALAAGLALARADDPPPLTVRVVTSDGRPAAGAKVWAYGHPEPTEPTPFVADAAGAVSV